MPWLFFLAGTTTRQRLLAPSIDEPPVQLPQRGKEFLWTYPAVAYVWRNEESTPGLFSQLQAENGIFVTRYGVTHQSSRGERSIPPGMFATKDEDKVL